MNTDHRDYTRRSLWPYFKATVGAGSADDKFREWGAVEVCLVQRGFGKNTYMLRDDDQPGWFPAQVSTPEPQSCYVNYPPKHRYGAATAEEAWARLVREQDEEEGREHMRWIVQTLGKTWAQAELDKIDGCS